MEGHEITYKTQIYLLDRMILVLKFLAPDHELLAYWPKGLRDLDIHLINLQQEIDRHQELIQHFSPTGLVGINDLGWADLIFALNTYSLKILESTEEILMAAGIEQLRELLRRATEEHSEAGYIIIKILHARLDE